MPLHSHRTIAVPTTVLNFFIAGFAALAYQIVSFKFISTSGLGDAISVAISLTAFVAISGFGALFAGRVTAQKTFLCEFTLGIYALLLFGTVHLAGIDQLVVISGAFSLTVKLLLFSLLSAPLAFLAGMLVPLHQHRYQTTTSNASAFSSFVIVFVAFHFGGAVSLVLIEQYGFPNIGWPQVGLILGIISIVNAAWTRSWVVAGNAQGGFQESFRANRITAYLFLLSVLTGFVGIATYKIFDYVVGPNIRNYTVLTAAIFVGLGISGLLAGRMRLTFKDVVGLTAAGCVFLALAVSWLPTLTFTLIDLSVNPWLTYTLVAVLLAVPMYSLVGLSIPASVRLGVRSDVALFVVSIGNAIGYWLYIATAHLNADMLLIVIFTLCLTIFSSVRTLRLAIPLALMAAVPLSNSFHPATHHIVLANSMPEYVSLRRDAFRPHELNSKVIEDFEVIKSWNTYGWPTEHVRVTERLAGKVLTSHDFLVINGFISLRLTNKAKVTYSESMAAAIPALFSDERRRALVLGGGTGISANAAATLYSDVEVVDISPDTARHFEYFASINSNAKSKVTIHNRDALSFLAEVPAEDPGYDLIFSTVTGAGYQFSAMLYTQEFFSIAKTKLADGGVFAFWIDARFGEEYGAAEIISAMKNQFPHVKRVSVYPKENSQGNLSYQIVIGSMEPLEHSTLRSSELISYLTRLNTLRQQPHHTIISIDSFLKTRRSFPGPTISPDNHSANMKTLSFAYDYMAKIHRLAYVKSKQREN